MRRELSFCLLLLLAATPAVAQVQIDVRLEKDRYLVGERVVVLVDCATSVNGLLDIGGAAMFAWPLPAPNAA